MPFLVISDLNSYDGYMEVDKNAAELAIIIGFLHYMELGATLDIIASLSMALDKYQATDPDAHAIMYGTHQSLEDMKEMRTAIGHKLTEHLIEAGAVDQETVDRFEGEEIGAKDLIKSFWDYAIEFVSDEEDEIEVPPGQLPC
jgi:hypothetical protein